MRNVIPVLAVLAVLGLFGATVVSANGFGWFGGMTQEDHAAVQEAVQNGDYDSWKSLMESQITEERFNELQERQAEMGDRRTKMESRRAAIDAAFEAEDYDAWLEAVEGLEGFPEVQFVAEDNFSLFKEMHEAVSSGDFDKAQEIREELGLPERGNGEGHGAEGFGRGKAMRGKF